MGYDLLDEKRLKAIIYCIGKEWTYDFGGEETCEMGLEYTIGLR
jgi:hypothetical protein